MRYQQIEFFLKHALPYIHPDGSKQGDEAFRKYRDAIGSKTLGLLINELHDCDGIPEGYIRNELAKVIADRNELVHHLFQRPGIDPLSASVVEETIRYLDRQYEQAEELYRFAHTQSLAVLLAELSTHAHNNAEYAAYYEQLKALLPLDVEVINTEDPTKTIWRTTRIVQLLKLAEKRIEKTEGLTPLSRAGEFIRREAPDLKYRDYGIKKLRAILVVSELFDVFVLPKEGQTNDVVLYRSKG